MQPEFIRQLQVTWAKSDKDIPSGEPQKIHLLLYHLLEAGAVASVLWEEVLAESIKKDICNQLGVEDSLQAGRLLAYWVALHDIGKASPVFQNQLAGKNPAQVKKVVQSGLPIETNMKADTYHSLVSAKFLTDHALVPKEIATAISGHHGQWGAYNNLQPAAVGGAAWDQFRLNITVVLREVMAIGTDFQPQFIDIEKTNLFVVWFSGLICVSDWIASNTDYFDYSDVWQEPQVYYAQALEKAQAALRQIGWLGGWKPKAEELTFEEMYSFKGWDETRSEQKEAIQLYERFAPNSPFLMIVEAPTGIGKTEIAFYLADRWLQESGGNGMYIAMPTQATSNQIYERSLDILCHRYPEELINVILAHGQAGWNDNLAKIRVKGVAGDEGEQGLIASEWFQNNRKRTLLAPFGVGTVDQVFLSILQTRHFFVRLFGLKNKVIVFDEVHAYDTYMNTLFLRLLEWLRGLGASVIILSATLPEQTRREVVAAYCGTQADAVPKDNHYPRLTISSPAGGVKVEKLSHEEEREIGLHWLAENHLTALLEKKLVDGGCIAVICNTVKQAQKTYQMLSEANIVPPEDLILFHARFPFAWRKEIEDRVLDLFGKDAGKGDKLPRPYKAIVVATQVIEQSLDLDFDLMVTELAPVDLILQRVGRLHRHERGDTRPTKLRTPELVLLEPDRTNEDLNFGNSILIYEESTLLRTYHALTGKDRLKIISETRGLIKQVYDKDLSENLDKVEIEKIKTLRANEMKEFRKIKSKARSVLVPKPEDETLLYITNLELMDTENPEIHKNYQALTRDALPGVSVICLHSDAQGNLHLEPDLQGEQVELVTLMNDYKMQAELSRRGMNLSSPPVVNSLLKDVTLITLKDVPALRHYRILIFRDGRFLSKNYEFIMNKKTGLEWRRHE